MPIKAGWWHASVALWDYNRSNKYCIHLSTTKTIYFSRFVFAMFVFQKQSSGVLINVAKFTGVSSGTGVSSEFREILKNVFFHRAPPVLLLAFAPIEISYFNNLCNKFAAEARIGLVSFYGGERWSQRLHFHKYFPRNNHFLH